MLSFSPEVFLSLFAQYNAAIWPAEIAAHGLGLAALGLTLWPRRGAGRAIAAALTAMWLTAGIAYHLWFFATINFAAPAFAALFMVQAALLAWSGVIRGRLSFRFEGDAGGWFGIAWAALAFALAPLTVALEGRPWTQLAAFGVTPGPVTLFTLGMLLLAERRTPWHLLAIPVIWSAIAGSAAWLLGLWEDLALIAAAFAAVGAAAWRNRRARGSR